VEKAVNILNPENYSPAAWAYIGDAYYELAMRMLTLQDGPKKMSILHKETAQYVRASFQAHAAHSIEMMLTDEEKEILRRGRNVKSGHVPKSASPTEYRLSTGVEGLIGYLYLTDRESRAIEILKAMREYREESQ